MKKPGHYSLDEIKKQDISFESVRKSYEEISITVKAAFKNTPEQVIFTGCGSSYYLAASVSNYFIKYMDIPSIYLPCSELELNNDSYIKNRKTIIVPFTRNSSTSEVRSAIEKCRALPNVKTLAISCDADSSKYNDYVILCTETDEKSIVMTRSFSSMLYAGMIMTDILAGKNSKKLLELPDIARDFIPIVKLTTETLASWIKNFSLMVALGQGEYFGIAGETSIKIKEMCIIPTEAYYTMEYRHGPISIANDNTVFIIYTNSKTAANDLRLVKELAKLDSPVICVGERITEELKDIAYAYFDIPENCLPLSILPAQYLGVHWALAKGLDPDMPRNLAKAIIL